MVKINFINHSLRKCLLQHSCFITHRPSHRCTCHNTRCKGEHVFKHLSFGRSFFAAIDTVCCSFVLFTSQHIQRKSFFDQFDFFTAADPTHGYINYVDQPTCEAAGIINSTATQVFMSPDLRTVNQNKPRDSVRLTSKSSFNGGLFILDVAHSPAGCATWPAFWLVGAQWPTYVHIMCMYMSAYIYIHLC